MNKIIGTVIGGFDGRRGLIYHLAVATEFRGHGIGSRLMNEVEVKPARQRLSEMLFDCHALIMTKRRNTIKHHGWQSHGSCPFVWKRICI